MIEAAASGLQHFVTVESLLYLALGAIIGLVFGAIPGLGGPTALALLIPLTFGLDSFAAISLFAGVMGAVPFGGSITAILINTPGTAPNAATCLDGYPMARKGQAGMAIGAAGAASAVGGILGIVVLVIFMPILRQLVLVFGPPEFLMLALLGLSAVAVATPGQLLRGLTMGGVGLMLAFVGFDQVHGGVRYTLGVEYLWDGIRLIPALIGLFAIAEIINLSVRGGAIATAAGAGQIRGVLAGVAAVGRHWATVLRGSVIGACVGAVPGVGGTVASFLSYTMTVQLSREPDSFGQGNVQGVIAPEASNNAKDGGSLIPTLAFGIPGSTEMAVFLGALVLHGMQPGPLLILQHADIIFTLIYGLSFACVLASLVGFAATRWLVLITEVDVRLLSAVIPVIALVGAYALRGSFGDVVTAVVFGIVGYVMIRCGFPRLTLVIALVLGNLAEVSYFQTVQVVRGDPLVMISRPAVAVIAVLILISVAFPSIQKALSPGRRAAPTRRPDVAATASERAFALCLLLFALGYIAVSYTLDPTERSVPLAAAWATSALIALELFAGWSARAGRLLAAVVPWGGTVADRAPARLHPSVVIAQLVGLALGVYLVGFLIAVPAFVFGSLAIRAGRSLARVAAITAAVFLFVWILFEQLMGYELYRGVVFGAR